MKNGRILGQFRGKSWRPRAPISLDDARRIVGGYVEYYNQVRLHGVTGYVAPAEKLARREKRTFAARDRKLAEARQRG